MIPMPDFGENVRGGRGNVGEGDPSVARYLCFDDHRTISYHGQRLNIGKDVKLLLLFTMCTISVLIG